MTGIPKTIKISYSEIAFALDKSVSKLEEAVLKALRNFSSRNCRPISMNVVST